MLSSHLLNIYRLFNSDHASQGKEAASFHFNFLLTRFPSLNYKAIFVHKKEKIRITWHIFLAFLADISFSRLILAEKLTSVNSRSVTQIVSKQAFKKQPQQLSSSDWRTNLWYVLKAFYILVKMWKQKKMELYNCSFDKWFFYLKYNYSNEIIPNYFISGN